MASPRPSVSVTDFVSTPSDMAQRVRAFDWGKTVLGPMAQWPDALRVAVDICLSSRFPMFVWWGPQLINIYNDGYVPMLGKRHPAALGRPARDSWNDIWDVVGPQADAVMLRGEATWNERVKLVMERKGFTEDTYFTWSYSPIRDSSGKIGGLFCAVTEETERLRAEAALADSERRYRALATASSDVLYRMSADWSEMRGLDGRGFLADTQNPNPAWLAQYIDPDDQAQVMSSIRQAVHDKGVFELEHRVRRADGSLGWTFSRAVPILDDRGEITEWVGAATDVTAKKRDEAALHEIATRFEQQSRLFEQIASTTPDFIYVFGLDGRFLYANRRLLEVWGRTFDQAVGKSLYELGYPQWHADMHMRELRQVIETRQPIKGEVPFTGGSGISGIYEYIFTPVLGPGGEVEVIAGTTRDISEHKAAEKERNRLLESERTARSEAERASEAKSDFLATLSHELRTPLTPVLLTVSLMESNPQLPANLREDVATIRRNVELESRLISDLLDLTRIAHGKMQLENQELNLHLIVRSAVDICQREASAKLTVELNAAHHKVRGDSTRLQQVFWNLINNAIKFTAEDGTITVRSTNIDGGDDGGARVRIEVCDTGSGIDPAVLPRLFTAFEQGDVRASRKQAGLGLGLAISKKLTEAHGGTITAESKGRGHGATFTVELPVLVEAARAAGAPSDRPPRARPEEALQSLHVLLVEDHGPSLRVMERLLQHIGHRVMGVSSVASAMAAERQTQFDLLISDLGLPDGSGLDIMRELRERYVGRAIALTGYGMESDVAASREAGFAEHLIKPVDLAGLEAAIARVMKTQRRGDLASR